MGLTTVDRDLIMLSRVLRTPRLREFWMIGLPHAAPSVFSGMKVAMTLSVIGAVVAEFVSSEAGLGHALMIANSERSEEHTSELQSLMRISYAVFCLKQQNTKLISHNY